MKVDSLIMPTDNLMYHSAEMCINYEFGLWPKDFSGYSEKTKTKNENNLRLLWRFLKSLSKQSHLDYQESSQAENPGVSLGRKKLPWKTKLTSIKLAEFSSFHRIDHGGFVTFLIKKSQWSDL